MNWLYYSLHLALVLTSLYCVVQDVEPKTVSRGIETENTEWVFLEKFCFRSKIGKLKVNLARPKKYNNTRFYIYYDDPKSWEFAYKKAKTCEERTSRFVELDMICNCTEDCKCEGQTRFTSSRDRWWYVVMSRCSKTGDPTSGLSGHINLHLTNGDPDDVFQYEFSCDEFAVLPTSLAFLVIFLVLLGVSVYFAVQLKNRHLLHSTFKLYLTAVCFKLLHLVFSIRSKAEFAHTGVESLSNDMIGDFFSTCANVFFVLLLILMSKGFTITRASISPSGTMKIIVFFFIYFFLSIVLFISESLTYDPARDSSRFDSVAGWCVVGLHAVGWIWFTRSIVVTLKNYPEKLNFYAPFYILLTIWFLALPVTLILANLVMDSWAREKIVHGVELTTSFGGFLFFAILTRPTAANKNFPFHVRTTQVDVIMENGDRMVERRRGRGGGGGGGGGGEPSDPTSFPRANNRCDYNMMNGQAAVYAIPMTKRSIDGYAIDDDDKDDDEKQDGDAKEEETPASDGAIHEVPNPTLTRMFSATKL